MTPATLERFFEGSSAEVLVEVEQVQGSTPREEGAFLLVSATGMLGTIGGGQLEFRAIEAARAVIGSRQSRIFELPLGPEIGQCCGGYVHLRLTPLDRQGRETLMERVSQAYHGRPHVYVFGAGHVGRELGTFLALLPVRVMLIDTRETELAHVPEGVEPILAPMPEAIVRQAPAKAAFVVLTHDHSLDFLVVREALLRRDAAYIGMIGSKTKRAVFTRWFLSMDDEPDLLASLTLPIGGGVRDKRPAVIAVQTAAEIIQVLAQLEAESRPSDL